MAKTKYTNTRLTVLGNRIYLDEFDKPVRFGFKQKNPTRGKRDKDKLVDEDACVRRSRKLFRDLVTCNAFQYRNEKDRIIPPVYITFTFAENVQDLGLANKEFNKFIKRYSYLADTKLMYQSSIEKQKRGAIHYHALFYNLPFIPDIKESTENCWRQGYIFANTPKDINKITNYLLKYIQKEFSVNHVKNKRRFLSSKGLKRPISFLDENDISNALKILPAPVAIQDVEFTDHEGRTVQRTILDLAPDSNFSDRLPQDTETLARRYLS
jgi:hypothetical protein